MRPRGDHAIQPPRLDHSINGQKPSIGRIVHFTGEYGECFAAIVTRVTELGACDLTVFPPQRREPLTLTDMSYSDTPEQDRWHWPERV